MQEAVSPRAALVLQPQQRAAPLMLLLLERRMTLQEQTKQPQPPGVHCSPPLQACC